MSYFYYCPVCGTTLYFKTDHCRYCKSGLPYHESKRNAEYYKEKAMQLYKDSRKWEDVLYNEEIKRNPIFELQMYEYAKTKEASDSAFDQFNNEFRQKRELQNENVPKCPTCNSSNIKKISGMKRSIHGYAFGLFSKTATSQFECNNCGYKW